MLLVLVASFAFGDSGGRVYTEPPENNATIQTAGDKASVIPTADEIKLHNIINAARLNPSSVGWSSYPAVGILYYNANLWKAAQFHSQEMITNNYFDHNSYTAQGVLYDSCGHRITVTFGYTPEGNYGENIAMYPTVEQAFAAWLTSQGHRDNIFRSAFNEDGIGVAVGGPNGKMETQDFGHRSIQFDLSVSSTDISFNPSSPHLGDNVQITVAVHELAKTHAFPVAVQFYDGNPSSGGQLIKQDTVRAIIAYNSSENLTATWNTTGENTGTHQIWVKVDPANSFSETNENNNSASKNIGIGVEEASTSSLALNFSAIYDKGIEFSYSLGFYKTAYFCLRQCDSYLVQIVIHRKPRIH